MTSMSQYYTALTHTEGKQFAKLMQSYRSKTLALSNVCNFVFIKTFWVSESKLDCFRLMFTEFKQG